jgi:hypothetical protein
MNNFKTSRWEDLEALRTLKKLNNIDSKLISNDESLNAINNWFIDFNQKQIDDITKRLKNKDNYE